MFPFNETDTTLHFFVSLAIAAIFCGLFSMLRAVGPWGASALTFACTMLIGILKEIYDSRQPGNHFCWRDIAADALGAIIPTILAWPANYLTWAA